MLDELYIFLVVACDLVLCRFLLYCLDTVQSCLLLSLVLLLQLLVLLHDFLIVHLGQDVDLVLHHLVEGRACFFARFLPFWQQ